MATQDCIDVILPSFGRLRITASTKDRAVRRRRSRIVKDLGYRLQHETLRAIRRGDFSWEEAEQAYKDGRLCDEHLHTLGKSGPRRRAHWRGGTYRHEGYVRVMTDGHPWPRRCGWIFEHVRVMELHIGRRLRRNECVHHKDHDRQNNALENLQRMTKSAHTKLHHKLRKQHAHA